MDKTTKETLQKQLQLLSERSKDEGVLNDELVELTHAMCEVADILTPCENSEYTVSIGSEKLATVFQENHE